ncbi:MAG: TonB-dependent receptor [Bacteroidetes bacterium]|nr:TonB-dependent receptor [Bacteroidota bacterium]MDA1335415.1 TonB-dependent receptor [Bacteroidota bacterium]
MKNIIQFALMGLFCATATISLAQITGKVTDASSGGALPGATVMVEGSSSGVAAGPDGTFRLNGAAEGNIVVSFIGYETRTLAAKADMGSIGLEPTALGLGAASIIANVVDIAIARETPVAVSTISPAEIAQKVGNMEFPEIMNRTPGVYATKQGGGYGDSRISLRGFDQRNTSFLINGQPVNDMENGWVYWSNWQGLTDVASGIQIQRGLGASRLAVPSVGGTVSIFTKAAQMEQGGSVSETIGNDGYAKTSVSYSTGKNDNGWASSFLLSKWAGDGYVYGTQGEGWTYFAAVGYEPEGSKHAMNLSVLGAGQWHHQRDAWVSIRDYENFGEEGIDRRWNTDAGFRTIDGERQEFSMRRNFYNKPLATFNWDWTITENLTLNTSVYGSAGRGGGTGPRGQYFRNGSINNHPYNADLTQHYLEDSLGSRDADGFIDFDAVVAANIATTNGYGTTDSLMSSNFYGQLIGSNGYKDEDVNRAVEIRRASMNSHDWVGVISNLEYNKENIRASVGVDLRNYKGYHYRALNDLMGLDGYYSTGNKNSMGQIINTTIEASPFNNTGLNGPKMDYYNVGNVGWAGLNGLVEYNNQNGVTAVVQAGFSNQSYQREDYFDQPNNPISEVHNQPGGYVKGGANYNINESSNVFFNAGMISRQPNFDAIFPNYANNINEDVQNESINSLELGYGYVSSNFTLNANVYSTTWGNRFISRSVDVAINDSTFIEGTAQFSDIDVQHSGIELEANYYPMDGLKVIGMLSLGNWSYTKDFEATIYDDNNNQIGEATLYTNGAKVGDAAQTVANLGIDYRVNPMISVDLGARYVDGLYADYSINSSSFLSPDNPGALKLPSYSLLDLGTTARFDLLGTDASFRINVNNLLDTEYIAESNTSIHAAEGAAEEDLYNGIDKSNYVWFGFGRTWNVSLKLNF